MDSAGPPLAVYHLHGGRRRHLRHVGRGEGTCRMGIFRAAVSARLAHAHRPVHVHAALCLQVARRAAHQHAGVRAMVGKASNKPKKAAKKGDGSKPVLLSGGNPQIPKGNGEAPVRAYLDAMPGWKQGVGRRLDALVERTVPDVRKAVKWNSPLYGAPDAPPDPWFLSLHCFDRYVKVTFFQGSSLHPTPAETSKSPAELGRASCRERVWPYV